jgi:hypothetical protein
MTQDEFFSTLRSGSIFLVGAATVMGVNALSVQDLQGDLDHMINGAKEFMLGAGPLIAIGLAWWGKYKASLPSQVATVQSAAPAALVDAVQAVHPVALRDAVAAQPDVKAIVVTTQAVADASPSAKVTTAPPQLAVSLGRTA